MKWIIFIFQIRMEFTRMKSDYHSKFMDKKVLTHTDMDTILEMGKLILM
jgi:competence protein ComGF